MEKESVILNELRSMTKAFSTALSSWEKRADDLEKRFEKRTDMIENKIERLADEVKETNIIALGVESLAEVQGSRLDKHGMTITNGLGEINSKLEKKQEEETSYRKDIQEQFKDVDLALSTFKTEKRVVAYLVHPLFTIGSMVWAYVQAKTGLPPINPP